MPTYLKSELHFDLNNSGFVSLAPYLGCFFIALVAGRIGDFMLQVSTGTCASYGCREEFVK